MLYAPSISILFFFNVKSQIKNILNTNFDLLVFTNDLAICFKHFLNSTLCTSSTIIIHFNTSIYRRAQVPVLNFSQKNHTDLRLTHVSAPKKRRYGVAERITYLSNTSSASLLVLYHTWTHTTPESIPSRIAVCLAICDSNVLKINC